MERWLSKSRVLAGLCVVLLSAALNRQDPMVYAMFLFLSVIWVLGYVLPWLSLAGTTLQADPAGALSLTEGQGGALGLRIVRRLPWPAFMVDVESEWDWAGQRTVLRHTLAMVRRGTTGDLGPALRFPCRGVYRLVDLRLASGFPLGLVRASHRMTPSDLQVCVLPRPWPLPWPMPWRLTDDPLGDLHTPRRGPSMEFAQLRPYDHGEPLGRVNWRASARAGELVVQQFQHTGSVRLHVVVEVPTGRMLADPEGAGEQAIRLAAGVCELALQQQARLVLHLTREPLALQDLGVVLEALAQARAEPGDLPVRLAQAAAEVQAGEQLAVVVAANTPVQTLIAALAELHAKPCAVLVAVAVGRQAQAAERQAAQSLDEAVQAAGWTTWRQTP